MTAHLIEAPRTNQPYVKPLVANETRRTPDAEATRVFGVRLSRYQLLVAYALSVGSSETFKRRSAEVEARLASGNAGVILTQEEARRALLDQ